jgi:hypothetical protein
MLLVLLSSRAVRKPSASLTLRDNAWGRRQAQKISRLGRHGLLLLLLWESSMEEHAKPPAASQHVDTTSCMKPDRLVRPTLDRVGVALSVATGVEQMVNEDQCHRKDKT